MPILVMMYFFQCMLLDSLVHIFKRIFASVFMNEINL